MVQVFSFPRDDFLNRRWRYRPGEHVTILGPTGCGKTWLGYQLLEKAATPKLPAVVLVMKPRDKTVVDWSKSAGFRTVRSWPPPPKIQWFEQKPPGYVLWPKHSFDPARDDYVLHVQFRRAILDCYKRGRRILFADEAWGLVNELKLERELVTLWTRGRSMECGLWTASQKPTHIPLHAYSMAEHLFLHNDPDERNRERFAEIGGVDPKLVKAIVASLDLHQWLYLRRADRAMCIVQK